MAILASDNFTRANSADLGTSWDECTGEGDPGGFNISSNTAISQSLVSDTSETNNAATWPNDQYSEATFNATAADGVGVGSGVTCRAATGATVTYYRLVGNASGYELGRKVNGAFTLLSNGSGTTFAAGDKIRLEVRTNGANCDWILKKNGTQFASGTDTSPIASGRAGIGYSSTSSSQANTALSAWEGGDFTSSSTDQFNYDDSGYLAQAFDFSGYQEFNNAYFNPNQSSSIINQYWLEGSPEGIDYAWFFGGYEDVTNPADWLLDSAVNATATGNQASLSITANSATASITATLTGIIDDEMWDFAPNSNRSSSNVIQATNYDVGDYKRILIKEPSYSGIPVGANVISATLNFTISSISGNQTLSIYKLLKNWDLTTSSWNNYSTGNAWNTGGAEGAGTDRVSSATSSLALTDLQTGNVSFSVTSDVQDFVNGNPNYGWLIKRTDGANDFKFAEFCSGDHATLFPTLTVTYGATSGNSGVSINQAQINLVANNATAGVGVSVSQASVNILANAATASSTTIAASSQGALSLTANTATATGTSGGNATVSVSNANINIAGSNATASATENPSISVTNGSINLTANSATASTAGNATATGGQAQLNITANAVTASATAIASASNGVISLSANSASASIGAVTNAAQAQLSVTANNASASSSAVTSVSQGSINLVANSASPSGTASTNSSQGAINLVANTATASATSAGNATVNVAQAQLNIVSNNASALGSATVSIAQSQISIASNNANASASASTSSSNALINLIANSAIVVASASASSGNGSLSLTANNATASTTSSSNATVNANQAAINLLANNGNASTNVSVTGNQSQVSLLANNATMSVGAVALPSQALINFIANNASVALSSLATVSQAQINLAANNATAIINIEPDEQYPLAGLNQDRPLKSGQQYPLSGKDQQYPLIGK
jgi:hypothetical protein